MVINQEANFVFIILDSGFFRVIHSQEWCVSPVEPTIYVNVVDAVHNTL